MFVTSLDPVSDQYMFGDEYLVAPVLSAGVRSRLAGTTFSTPSGTPARAASAAIASAVSGVSSAGLMTTGRDLSAATAPRCHHITGLWSAAACRRG